MGALWLPLPERGRRCCGGTVAVSREKANQFDYETELVIMIGRTARNVSEADALSYIFGYCTGNDFTARDRMHLGMPSA